MVVDPVPKGRRGTSDFFPSAATSLKFIAGIGAKFAYTGKKVAKYHRFITGVSRLPKYVAELPRPPNLTGLALPVAKCNIICG